MGDGIGYIELVDHMGTDITHVNAARASFNKKVEEMGPGDPRLIDFPVRKEHWAPLAHAQLHFRVKGTISLHREWVTHNVGVINSSESTRYVDVVPEFYIPLMIRSKVSDKKQGSGEPLSGVREGIAKSTMLLAYDDAWMRYRALIDNGVANEVARDVLPLGTYMTWVCTMSLYAAHNLYRLRTGEGAQKEIGWYAEALGQLVQPLFPVAWESMRLHDEIQPRNTVSTLVTSLLNLWNRSTI